MKRILFLLMFWGCFQSIQAQHDIRLDVENVMICLVDSISTTEQNVFYRIRNVHDGVSQDVDYKLQAQYNVTGTIIPCSDVGGSASNGGCLVNNSTGLDSLQNVSKTYTANSYHSISIAVLSGSVTITNGATAVVYDSGSDGKAVFSYKAPDNCSYITNDIIVDATGGSNRAYVSFSQ